MVLYNRSNDSIWLLFNYSKMCRTGTTNTWTSDDLRKWLNSWIHGPRTGPGPRNFENLGQTKILKTDQFARVGPWYWWSVDPWFYSELKTSLEWRKFTLIISQFHRVWQTSLNLDKLYKSEAYSRFTFLDLRLLKIVQHSRTFKIIQDYKLQSRNKCYSVNHEFIRKLSLSLKNVNFRKSWFLSNPQKLYFINFNEPNMADDKVQNGRSFWPLFLNQFERLFHWKCWRISVQRRKSSICHQKWFHLSTMGRGLSS